MNSNVPDPDGLLTTRQVAEMVGRTPKTVTLWVKAGVLPAAMKIPGRTGGYLFRRTLVEALLPQFIKEQEGKARLLPPA